MESNGHPLITAQLPLIGEQSKAWIVVDSIVDGLAIGGTRMTPTVDQAEVASLARAMTTKLALVGLPVGGAKAGIRVERPLDGPQRNSVLTAFGVRAAPFLRGGIYLGCDQGTTPADRQRFFAAAGYVANPRPPAPALRVSWSELWDRMHDITGRGVGVAVLTALRAVGEATGQRSVVQGFGTVGRAVALFLADHGHRVIAVADALGTVESAEGLPIGMLVDLTGPDGTIDRDRLPEQVRCSEPDEYRWRTIEADITVLAAGSGAIDSASAHQLRSHIVVEGGNLACTPDGRDVLRQAGVAVVPDVVANVGGAAVTGSLLSGTAPTDLPLVQLVHWLQDWVCTKIARNSSRAIAAAAAGELDVVDAMLRDARRPVAQ